MQILIFYCPRRSMLICQKCQKALRVTALYFAAYVLAAEILNALRYCMASDFKQYYKHNLLTLSLCIWQASLANERNSHTVSKYVNLLCNISCKS